MEVISSCIEVNFITSLANFMPSTLLLEFLLAYSHCPILIKERGPNLENALSPYLILRLLKS